MVDYRMPDWAGQVREAAGGVDVVPGGVGGLLGEAAFGLLAAGGRMLVHGMASGAFTGVSDEDAAARGVTMIRGVPVAPELVRSLTSAALAGAAAGRLRPVIGQRFGLAEAAAAHAAIGSRVTAGKTLLVPGASRPVPAGRAVIRAQRGTFGPACPGGLDGIMRKRPGAGEPVRGLARV